VNSVNRHVLVGLAVMVVSFSAICSPLLESDDCCPEQETVVCAFCAQAVMSLPPDGPPASILTGRTAVTDSPMAQPSHAFAPPVPPPKRVA
jgi:hypothetical protein